MPEMNALPAMGEDIARRSDAHPQAPATAPQRSRDERGRYKPGRSGNPRTQFRPGVSGNAAGTSRALARRHTAKAIEALLRNLSDPNGAVRNAAALRLLEHGWGKATV